MNYRLNSSHVKTLSARAPQYYQDGTLLEVTKPSLKEEAYFGESYNFELSAGYLRTFADVLLLNLRVLIFGLCVVIIYQRMLTNCLLVQVLVCKTLVTGKKEVVWDLSDV